jgi:uncharacterized protein (DUF2252 family)
VPTKEVTFPAPEERAAALKARRQMKVARSAHAYVRGNTKNFYEWLEGSVGKSVPEGPPIWICGDCHAGNIGPIASAKGTVAIQIRDLDQTVVGNPAHDLLRCAALVSVGGKKGELCLIDIKEAVPALAPRSPVVEMPNCHAERVVKGAWSLSPALGDRMLAAKVLEHPVFVRELLPQDLKFDVADLTCEEAMRLARFLAMVVGKAHARQMDEPARTSWQTELSGHRCRTLDAPSWLWASVVDLLATHEKAYLEHCRRYAVETVTTAAA